MQDRELARRVLKQAGAFPENFSMQTWGMPSTCGTVACLAGHAMLLSGYSFSAEEYEYTRPDGTAVGDPGREGQMLLGLSDEEMHKPGSQECLFTTTEDRALAWLAELAQDSE